MATGDPVVWVNPRIDLSVRLLGTVAATFRGRAVTLPSRNAAGLLALLTLHRRPRTRETIATELWPDAGASSMVHLRQALWLLGKNLDESGASSRELLFVDRDVIAFQTHASIESDTVRFEQFLRSRPPHPEDAVALYGGDLAENLGLECLTAYREELSDLYEDSLAAVAQERLDNGDLEGARAAAVRLIERDPLREDAHRVIIDLYGRSGTRDQVVRQFRRLKSLLERELGVRPLPETEKTYRTAMAVAHRRSARSVRDPLFSAGFSRPHSQV